MSSAGNQMAVRRVAWFVLLFFAYLVMFSALDGFALFSTGSYLFTRVDSGYYVLKALFYVATSSVAIISVVCLTAHRWAFVGITAYLYLFFCFTVQLTLLSAKGHVFTINEAFLTVSDFGFFDDAVQEYLPNLLRGCLGAFAITVALICLNRKSGVSIQSRIVLLAPIFALGLAWIVIEGSSGRISKFPIVVQLPVNLYFALTHELPYKGKRDEPYIEPTKAGFAKHILFIVDESIRGDLLSINNPEILTTPYLKDLSSRIQNYGIASSAANHSGASNIIMQSGLRLDKVPDIEYRALKNPNVFAYMKLAGYKTYLINNQLLSNIPDNKMSTSDIANLDGYLLPRMDGSIRFNHEVDTHSIRYIMDILNKGEPSFTYLVKHGAHFPYQKGYPHDTQSVFIPAIESNTELRVDRERTTNSYFNTVRWNVDVFFERLIADLDGLDVLIIYTSDHGENLLENSSESPTRGHGTGINPTVFEASVPLFLLPLNDSLKNKLDLLYNEHNVNRVSGFQVFSSLLYLAGYDKKQVTEIYGGTIFDERTVDNRKFLSGNIFGIGSSSINTFDLTLLSLPDQKFLVRDESH